MNRLVIIGNGFDLNHGLKTSYRDFILWYLEEALKSVYQTDQSAYSDRLLAINVESQTDERNNVIRPKPGKDEFDEYMKKNDRNPWLLLQSLQRQWMISFKVLQSPLLEKITYNVETKGWTDIESDYYELLKKNSSNTYYCRQLNEQMDLLREKLAEYLKSLPPVNPGPAIECFLSSSAYLEEVAQGSMEVAKTLVTKDDASHPRTDIKVQSTMLLDFNYTNTTDIYLSDTITINHIHGSIKEPERMIFGYGDEMDKDFQFLEDLNDNELLKNSKSVKYLETGNYRELLGFMNGGLFQVYVMGHSCGNSDRTLLNTIFEHENCVSIKPFCFIGKGGRDNYSELTRNIYRNFKDKTLFRDRVVNKTQCKTFAGLPLTKSQQSR